MIAGKYVHEKNEGLKDFVMALGITAELADKADSIKTTYEITHAGQNVTIKIIYPHKEETLAFTFGQEFDDPMPNGEKLKSVATLEGNKITVKSKRDGAEVGFRCYEFSDSQVVITMKANHTDKVGKRYFKRV